MMWEFLNFRHGASEEGSSPYGGFSFATSKSGLFFPIF